MGQKLTNNEIVGLILEEDLEIVQENEDLIYLLLDERVSKNVNESHKENLSFGNRASDKIAASVGSWPFIIVFCVILFIWIVLNTAILLKAFDPYPYIFLNLVLSCIAALQAPVIMMSQNRLEQKDRLRSENDYKVNLKAEVIVEDIHTKLDKLIVQQEQITIRLDAMDKPKELEEKL